MVRKKRLVRALEWAGGRDKPVCQCRLFLLSSQAHAELLAAMAGKIFTNVWPKWTDYGPKSIRGAAGRGEWWAHQDLNLGPSDYESPALTN